MKSDKPCCLVDFILIIVKIDLLLIVFVSKRLSRSSCAAPIRYAMKVSSKAAIISSDHLFSPSLLTPATFIAFYAATSALSVSAEDLH